MTRRGLATCVFGLDLLSLPAEYTQRVWWAPFYFLLLYDTGQVAYRMSDFSFASLRQNWGLGVVGSGEGERYSSRVV